MFSNAIHESLRAFVVPEALVRQAALARRFKLPVSLVRMVEACRDLTTKEVGDDA